ncbi:MFS transporter [Phyllobacterium leguminum]|uniref:Putative MFS family arabinose efflux permease n=1 Tax=Phyllobacterium leguminum TaxID=314237 RepID=A0A318T8C4_9HYPH|nr:MFS transporter [Phyllobacterium leguminum]PYE89561.1 putative MFS family arabinose efflux permease [Phyllobacterium leguminum]
MIDVLEHATEPTAGLGPSARTLIASVLGNGLEWFDFVSYGLFAELIARAFFPEAQPGMALVLAFSVFAIGFVVRPLGGILFGLYADRAGRRSALTVIMAVMAAGSLILALAPSYVSIGLAAPILILTARILQGLSVGGEFASASVFLVEHAPPGRRMFYGSLQMCSQGVGVLVASAFAFALQKSLPPDQLANWGWRIPFFVGAMVGPFGLYLRWRVAETPEFVKQIRRRAKIPPLSSQLPALLCGIGLVAVGTAISQLWHSYLSVYVVRELHLPRSDASLALTLAGIVEVCTYPLVGLLADRVGAFRVFFWGATVYLLIAWPLYAFMLAEPNLSRLLMGQLVASLLFATISGCHPGLLAALFPVSVRSTGVALSYNTAVLVFGGLAPATVTWLIEATGSPMMPAIYQIAIAIFSLALVAATMHGRRWG